MYFMQIISAHSQKVLGPLNSTGLTCRAIPFVCPLNRTSLGA
jgi:hypothetical protein